MPIHLFRKENKSLFLTFKVLIYFYILIQNSPLKEYQYSLEMVLIFATFELVQLNEFFWEGGGGVLNLNLFINANIQVQEVLINRRQYRGLGGWWTVSFLYGTPVRFIFG